jgi:hypothetical protein
VWQIELHVGGVDLAGEDAASRVALLMVFFCTLFVNSRFPMRGVLFRFKYGVCLVQLCSITPILRLGWVRARYYNVDPGRHQIFPFQAS